VYQEPLDHGRQGQKAKGDEGVAETEADSSFCPREGQRGTAGQQGTGEQACSQRRAAQVWRAGE